MLHLRFEQKEHYLQVEQLLDEQVEHPLPPEEVRAFSTAPAIPNTDNNLSRLRDLHFGQLASSDSFRIRNSKVLPQSRHRNSLTGIF